MTPMATGNRRTEAVRGRPVTSIKVRWSADLISPPPPRSLYVRFLSYSGTLNNTAVTEISQTALIIAALLIHRQNTDQFSVRTTSL